MMSPLSLSLLLVPAPRAPLARVRMASDLVVCEGEDWIVANKPAGVSVHDAGDSLVSRLAAEAGCTCAPCQSVCLARCSIQV